MHLVRRLAVPAAILLLLSPSETVAGKKDKTVCEGGTFFAEGLAPLGLGEERALGDFAVIDIEAATVRIAGCEPVPARVRGKRNQKVKAELPVGACPGVDAIGKLKLRLKEDCGLAKGKVKFKTKPRQKRKIEARPGDDPEIQLEEASAVSETIGPAGGSLETTDSTGRHYRLEIPEGAIAAEWLVELTPVAAMGGLPIDGLAGAVDLSPAGLHIVPYGTLTIEFPEPVDTDRMGGFGYGDADAHVGVSPIWIDSEQSVRVPVFHFSGAGAGSASSASQFHLSQVTAAANLGDLQLLTAACATWYDAQVGAALANASNDAQAANAVQDFVLWEANCRGVIAARFAAGLVLLRPLLEAAIERDYQDCTNLKTYETASNAMSWQMYAHWFVIATGPLAYDTVREGLCIEVSYVDTSYPGTPQPGVSHSLDITVGATFDGGAPDFSQPLRVDVQATGASPATAGGQTDNAGHWSGTFAVDGGEDAVFNIDSCLTWPHLTDFCQPALIVRGLEVSPGSATIDAGATQQFEAQRFGQAYTNVTWSASGGTISANGLFTAPPAAGNYTVTATDTANPGSSATASVTVNAVVVGNCLDTSTFVPVNLGATVQLEDQVDGGAGMAPASFTVTDGVCEATARTFGFGHIEATLTGDASDCGNSTLRANASTTDYVRITPADPTRFVATVRGSYEYEVTGSASASGVPDPIRGFAGHSQGMWAPSAGGFTTGTSYLDQGTLAVELTNQPGRTFFPAAWNVSTQGLVAPSNHDVQVSASLRWLGITAILDQDGNPIVDYAYCSVSGTDYRQPVP